MTVPKIASSNSPSLSSSSSEEKSLGSKWQEIAILASALALIALSGFSIFQIGFFAHSSYTSYVAFAAEIAAMLVLGLYICYRNNPVKSPSIEPEMDKTPADEQAAPEVAISPPQTKLPAIPLKERLPSPAISKPCSSKTYYSSKRSTAEKLAIQLDYAVRQGKKDLRRFKSEEFKVDLSVDIAKENRQQTNKNFLIHSDPSLTLSTAGAAECQARRADMEDAHLAVRIDFPGHDVLLAAVFDGHGDKGVASKLVGAELQNLVQHYLPKEKNLDDEHIIQIFFSIFKLLDLHVIKELYDKSVGGTTLTCAFVIDGRCFTFNIGDSRTVLVRKDGVAYQLSEDALPEDPRFQTANQRIKEGFAHDARIQARYGPFKFTVARDLGVEVLCSRAKATKITENAQDDLVNMQLGYKKGDYLLLACDGFWDVCTLDQARDALLEMDQQGLSPKDMAAQLVYAAVCAGGHDNVSVVVLKI